ncbi:MAG: hypothetical protein RLZZ28_1523, partial [Bacteroidota bacterium]
VYKDLFMQAANDSSYSVAGAALLALNELDGKEALAIAKKLAKEETKGRLKAAINAVFMKNGDETTYEIFDKLSLQEKFGSLTGFVEFLGKETNAKNFTGGVDMLLKLKREIPASARQQTDPFINMQLKGLADKKSAAGAKELADYILEKIK